MKKFSTLLFILVLSPLIAGCYGILHDQITYTISPEYYTKFKFIQFGMYGYGIEPVIKHPRLYVCSVGFLATWWMGPPIALILGWIGMFHKDHKVMLSVTLKALALTLLIAFLTGLTGLAYGKLYLASSGVSWWLPDVLEDKENFIAVGSMHNFSYFGGLIGLIAGILYSLRQRTKFQFTVRTGLE